MGNYGGSYGGALGDAFNPVAMLARTKNNKATDNRLFGNIFIEADLPASLILRSSFSGANSNGNSRAFVYPQYENAENNISNSYSESSYPSFDYTWTNTLSFNKQLSVQKICGTDTAR
ncbi:hypothetical protein H9X96_00695 [Pedobacter sp. N36a]|uniref:hypothetical protein n=1 Tax=Pedobacter sp. N36a TaxID=2767996 RepID=UPI001657087E|nr:hypothetical protein [Pedobacter sp. N36a]MBC8984286.1 hypothetical protein [Pedobacter sp. N36a]